MGNSSLLTVLFFGDIVGEPALKHLCLRMPSIIESHSAEFVVANGENIWDGKGLNDIEANMLFKAGANVITTGNHVWENWKSRPLLATNNRVLRPFNYPSENPGNGFTSVTLPDGLVIGVIQIQGRVYMQAIDCPFKAVDYAINHLQQKTSIIITDFHADATAEKIAMGWYVDGRVSAIIGTHTHVQTNDARVLPEGTAYLTDVGMCGPHDSVLGMKKDIALKRMLLQTAHKYEMAIGDYRINYAKIIINADTGRAESITTHRVYCGDSETPSV
jgi:2',3'-cyclic-nucleotide 2'-phosphodiesterase